MNLADLLESTADGAFAVNKRLEIVYWNQAAQELLGFDRSETVGYPCYEVLQGLDGNHRLFCRAFCRVARSVSLQEPIANYDIRARTKKGKRQWLNMSVLTYRQEHEGGNTLILHIFRDSTEIRKIEELFNTLLEAVRNEHEPKNESWAAREPHSVFDRLTPREEEILFFLTEGFSTREIAQTLVISPNTVRNHVQHILQKLHVRSRAEAVALAIRHGLVE